MTKVHNMINNGTSLWGTIEITQTSVHLLNTTMWLSHSYFEEMYWCLCNLNRSPQTICVHKILRTTRHFREEASINQPLQQKRHPDPTKVVTPEATAVDNFLIHLNCCYTDGEAFCGGNCIFDGSMSICRARIRLAAYSCDTCSVVKKRKEKRPVI